MSIGNGPCTSVDDQIFACIAAAKTRDKDAKLEDFQLRIVADDLVLFNLKTGDSFLIYDEDSDWLEHFAISAERQTTSKSQPILETALATESKARTAATIAVRWGTHLPKWFAPSQALASTTPRAISR